MLTSYVKAEPVAFAHLAAEQPMSKRELKVLCLALGSSSVERPDPLNRLVSIREQTTYGSRIHSEHDCHLDGRGQQQSPRPVIWRLRAACRAGANRKPWRQTCCLQGGTR